jgi:hypothetical protein
MPLRGLFLWLLDFALFIRGGSNTQEPACAGEPLGRFNSSANNGGVADPQYNKFSIFAFFAFAVEFLYFVGQV